MTEKLYKIITDPKTKIKSKNSYVQFSNFGAVVRIDKKLGLKFLTQIKRRKYNLVRKMIDIYKDNMVTSF